MWKHKKQTWLSTDLSFQIFGDVNAKHDSPMVTRVAVCCSVLQCVARVAIRECEAWLAYGNASCHTCEWFMSHVYEWVMSHTQGITCSWVPGARKMQLDTLQHTATHCNSLQQIATHCNTLQHTAAHCNKLQCTGCPERARCNTLQRTATHCNALQHTCNAGLERCGCCRAARTHRSSPCARLPCMYIYVCIYTCARIYSCMCVHTRSPCMYQRMYACV